MPNPLRLVLAALVVLVIEGALWPIDASEPARVRPGDPVAVAAAIEPDTGYSSYLELRIYQTRDGQRDRFLHHFEEHYLESQEEVGMRIWGQFRDLTAPDQFVWLRGYRTMDERQTGLLRFYTSPLWNETGSRVREMLAKQASHVHFLEPVSAEDAFDDSLTRTDSAHESGVVVALIFLIDEAAAPLELKLRQTLIPAFVEQGALTLGLFRSSDEANNFPALPFIEDERVVVWFASFASAGAFDSARAAVEKEAAPFETFVLEPGRRSRLRHHGD